MKAVFLDKVQTLSERELPPVHAKAGQVVVKMKAVGVCGSDVHYWNSGRIGPFVVKEPMILGHECAGVITEIGEGVQDFSIGQPVVLEPGIPCYTCDACKKGRYNLCPNILFFATPPVHGSLVEYVAYDAGLVFPIPETIQDFGLATMVEPLAVGVFATTRIQPQLGEKAVVFGAGIIGIACMLAAKAAGCRHVTVADIRDDRLLLAKQLGADRVVNLKGATLPPDFYDFGYEASGAESCYAAAASCIKSGGRLSLVGMGPEKQSLPLVDYICREISLIPSFRYGNAYPVALQILQENASGLQEAITHRYPFSLHGVEQALQTAHKDPTACKVIIDFEDG